MVIPAYNEATYIDRLLEALSRQRFEEFEVIVSDAQSNDGTREIVEGFSDRLDIDLIEAPPKGPGFGRNIGANQAKGGWLLFLDADVDIDDPYFIKTLLEETEARKWKTSSAKMMTKNGPSYAALFLYQRLLSHTKRPVASGYCIFTKRSVFVKSGGFNEKIHFGEDYEYVSRTGKHGFGFVKSTHYYVDPRRNTREGIRLTWKGTLNEIYRHIHGYEKLETKPISYEFGRHKPRDKNTSN